MAGVGVEHGLSELEYRILPGLRSSAIKDLLRSPAHYRVRSESSWPGVSRSPDPRRLGLLCHLMVLQPENLQRMAQVLPDDLNLRTKAGREERDELARAAEAEGCIVSPPEEWAVAEEVSAAVHRNHICAGLLAEGDPEVTLTWEDSPEVMGKARIDWLAPDAVVDLKTTRDASPTEFSRDCLNLGYHVSASWYLRGLRRLGAEPRPFIIIAAETCPPYMVQVYRMTSDWIQMGDDDVERALDVYREFEARKAEAPGSYVDGIAPLPLPGWARPREETILI